MRDWYRSFEDVPREHGFEPLRVEGELPAGLEGTYYRNGPGLVTSFGDRYRHWFDGDGLVTAVRYRDGAAEGGARVLETKGLLEERRRGARYFGAYGTTPPGLFNPLRMLRAIRGDSKNPANTNLLAWDGRLLALCEIGRPFEVHPETLGSMGETDLGGAVRGAFSAHPHRVASNGYVYNIGTRIGRTHAIDVYALRPDGTAGKVTRIPLEHPTMIHDFAATETHLVIFVAPLRLKLLPTLLGRASFVDSLVWEPAEGTEVIVVPLDAPASPRRFRVDPFWAWHVGNAFVRDDEIVVDLVRYPDFPTSHAWLAGVSQGGPTVDADGILGRCVIDPARERLTFAPMTDRTCEFPRVAPSTEGASHRWVYVAEHATADVGRHGPPNSIARVDTETGAADRYVFDAGHYPSEPVFSPAAPGDEARGWLHCLVYDAETHTSYFAILDATRVADGPVATAHLDHHVPLSFHGVWVARA